MGKMLNFKGVTKTLLFSILSVGFGSSFLYGYNIGVINAPQTVVGIWIRNVTCSRMDHPNSVPVSSFAGGADINGSKQNSESSTNGTTRGRGSRFENATEGDLWCDELTDRDKERLFRDNYKLNVMWTAVASVFCVGGLLGALSSNYLVFRFGRKGTLLLNNLTGFGALGFLVFPRLAYSYEMLLIGRFLAGLNGGVTSAVAPLYMVEIPPTNLRGTLGGLHQFFIVLAILISQILGHPKVLGNELYWPYLFGIGIIPIVFQLLTLPFCPESPKYLYLDKNKEVKAEKALKRLRRESVYGEEMEDLRDKKENTDDQRLTMLALFKDPFLRRVAIMSMIVTSCSHVSGHGTVIYYSTAVFKSAGLTGGTAIWATIGMGALYALSTFVTATTVEKAGRKTFLLIGLGGMCILTILLTIFMVMFQKTHKSSGAVKEGGEGYEWTSYASMVAIFLHTVIYSIGPGTIPAFLVSEMFTQGPRAAATSLALAVNWLSALIVVLTYPLVQHEIGGYTFLIFAGALAAYFVYVWFRVPETKGKTPEEVVEVLREKMGFRDESR